MPEEVETVRLIYRLFMQGQTPYAIAKYLTDRNILSKKRKANEGEVPQYYVEGSHDAIIEPAEWLLMQMEIQWRKNLGRSHNCCSPFSAKLKCGDCGADPEAGR